jgi:hypothetical protein
VNNTVPWRDYHYAKQEKVDRSAAIIPSDNIHPQTCWIRSPNILNVLLFGLCHSKLLPMMNIVTKL